MWVQIGTGRYWVNRLLQNDYAYLKLYGPSTTSYLTVKGNYVLRLICLHFAGNTLVMTDVGGLVEPIYLFNR